MRREGMRHRTGRSRRRVLAVLLCAFAPAAGLPARDPTAEDAEDHRRSAELQRSEYSGIWPFYTREVFEDERTRVTALFSSVLFEREPSGDYLRRVLPLFTASRQDDGRDRRLAVLPLLYWRRRSPEVDHDVVFPLFARWREDSSQHTVLFPLYQAAVDPLPAPFRFVPTLFRVGTWRERRETRWRIGAPYVLDLLAGAARPDRNAIALGTFLPFGRETVDGLPLSLWEATADHRHAHLFPLFGLGLSRGDADRNDYFYSLLFGFRIRGARRDLFAPPLLSWYRRDAEGYSLDVLFPLLHLRDRASVEETRLLPLYVARDRFSPEEAKGDSEGGRRLAHRLRLYSFLYGFSSRARPEGRRLDHFLPPLFARYGYETSRTGHYAWDVLYPVFHHSREGSGKSALRILPAWESYRDGDRRSLGVGLFLYRRYADAANRSDSHWALFPLVHHRRGPHGSRSWVLPLYLAGATEEERSRSRYRILLPVYYSSSEDVRPEDGGDWRPTRRSLHIWPFYGRSSSRSAFDDYRRDTDHGLFPLFRYSVATGGEDPARPEREIHFPWPIARCRWDLESIHLRLFPIIDAGRRPGEVRAAVFPLLTVAHGPESQRRFPHSFSFLEWHGRGDMLHLRVFPLLFEWKSEGDRLRVSGPLWWFHYRGVPGDTWFHILPLGFAHRRGADLRAGIFPLYYRRESGPRSIDRWDPVRFLFLWNTFESDRERHVSILWKAVELTSGGGDHDFRVLHRLFVKRKVRGQREFVINPFVSWFEDERSGRKSFRILHFLYSSETEEDRVRRRLLFVPLPGGRRGAD